MTRYWHSSQDVHDAVLVFGQQVEPTDLMMIDVGLQLLSLQAGIVCVQLEMLVKEIGLTFGTRRRRVVMRQRRWAAAALAPTSAPL